MITNAGGGPEPRSGGGDRADRGRSLSEVALAAALREAAERHEPDLGRIQSRVQAGIGRVSAASRRAPWRVQLPGWVVPAAAGTAVVAVMASAVVLLRPVPLTTPADPAPDLSAAPSVEAPEPRDDGEQETAPAPAPVTGEPPGLDVVTAQDDELEVQVGAAGERDWLVGGVDREEPELSARRNTDAQLLGVGTSGQPVPAVTTSPFAVTWSRGLPPWSTGSTRTWLEVSGQPGGPDSGFTVRVEPEQERRELVVYLGVVGETATAELLVDGTVTSSVSASGGMDAVPYVVTVPLSGVGDSERVEVRILAPEGSRVGFAGATLD